MKLFKYKSVDHIEDIIVNKRLFCSKFDKLNDPMEWAFTSEQDKEEIEKLIQETNKENWHICCLSKSEQYGLMWSMYGDNHKGICIEVDIDDSMYCRNNDRTKDSSWFYGDIYYCNTPTAIDDLRSDLVSLLWIKSKQWKHEQEVRFVKSNTDEKDVYLPVKIKRIFLGIRMNDEKKLYVKELCKTFNVQCVDMNSKQAMDINYWNDENGKPFDR